MKLGVIIQARMSSRRLPGKVLRPVAGKPLLAYTVERLARCVPPTAMVVATSRQPDDDPLADFCAARGLACFRGDLHNVASRFLEIFAAWRLDAAVRVNGDSPLLDPRLVDQGVRLFAEQPVELVTNVFPRSYPPGQSVEVIDAAAFRRAFAMMSEPEDFEHVTRFFYKTPNRFRIRNFAAGADYRDYHLAVDTEDHLRTVEEIVCRMDGPHWQYGLEEVVRLHPASGPLVSGGVV
jgi:spore coat polysaccharide biosynthesis protein SpsF